MRKSWLYGGRKQMAAAGLAVMLAAGAVTGCSGGTEGTAAEAGNTSSDQKAGEEKSGGAAEAGEEESETKAEEEKLPEYVPVDPASVAESAEEDFIYELTDTIATITGYQGSGGQVKIPESLGGSKSIAIGKDVFNGNETITYLYIPETVVRMESGSFRNCKALEEVYVGANLASLDKSMFKNCTALRRAELAGTISGIGGDMDAGAFIDCFSLTEVVFGENLQGRIATDAFRGCMNLETVDLSGTQIGNIGQCAFADCTNLKTVKLPENLGWIESNSFLNCPSLAEFEIAEGNGVLEEEAGIVYTVDFCSSYSPNTAMFGLAGALDADVTVREGTEIIASNAFEYIQTIKSVKIPDSVKEIERLAFGACYELEKVEFGNGLETIGQSAFNGCESLEEIDLPDSLQELGSTAFGFCNLKRVSLPDGVKYYKGETTEDYIFAMNKDAVFTYKGKEYTYDQAAELDALLAQ